MNYFLLIGAVTSFAPSTYAQTAGVNYKSFLRAPLRAINLNGTETDRDTSAPEGNMFHESDSTHAYFKDGGANKYYYVQVKKTAGKIDRVIQGIREPGKSSSIHMETISTDASGAVVSHTYCKVDTGLPGASKCESVNAKVCEDFTKKNLNAAQISKDLEKCGKLEKDLDEVSKIMTTGDGKSQLDTDLAEINGSEMAKYFNLGTIKKMGFKASADKLSAAQIKAIEDSKKDKLYLVEQIVRMSEACDALKSGFQASTQSPASMKKEYLPEGMTPVKHEGDSAPPVAQ